MDSIDFPAVNATLNGTSAVLVLSGYALIRRGRVKGHAFCMLSAVAVSAIFLASYLYYHFAIKGGTPTRFEGPPAARYLYLAILLSHTVLAVAVVPLVAIVLYRALSGQFARHVRLARWTLPIWLYVSSTGVVIYVMLYQIYAP